MALLAPLGFLVGLSAFAEGIYDTANWGLAAVAALGLLVAATIAGLPRLRPRAIVAIAALAGLWIWSWLSTGWAESAYQALESSNRWLLYAAFLAGLVFLVRDQRIGLVVLGAATAGIVVTAVYVLGRMPGSEGQELFLGGRLTEPLGYTNGQAAYFFIGIWPLLALAEASRKSWLGGLAVAGCVLLGGLMLLGQTRALVPGVAITVTVVIALVPGRLRRLAILTCVVAGIAVAVGPLLDIYGNGDGAPSESALDAAAGRLMLGALLAGGLWLALDRFGRAALDRSADTRRLLVRGGKVAVAIAAGVVLLAVGAKAGAIADEVSQGYDDFVNLETATEGESRFTSGGGARYDYWRIAWKQFGEKPLAGYGAGNYDRTYFVERRTSEDVRQPHSIELQTLAELGFVGGAFLVAFLGAVLLGIVRSAQAARSSPRALMTAVGGGGAFVAWLSHTSVDWLHVIPGLTGVALIAAAALLAPRERQRRLRIPRHIEGVAIVGVILVAIVGGLSAGRLAASERAVDQSHETLVEDPREALRKANRAFDLNDQSVPALIARSAAYARLGDYPAARGALLAATELEPHDFVPWGLLGDIAVRRRDFAAARAAYRRSRKLNPADPFVGALADDPRSAVPLEGGER